MQSQKVKGGKKLRRCNSSKRAAWKARYNAAGGAMGNKARRIARRIKNYKNPELVIKGLGPDLAYMVKALLA